jgi:small subunit ribosomal protein S6
MRPMLQWHRFLPRHRAVPSRAAQAVGADSDHGKGTEVLGTVTTYEILLMLDPEGAEAHQDDLIARVRDLVEKGGGTWRSHDAWGRRRLAYEIAKKPEGVYHLVVFESGAETLDEISRVLKIDDGVLRHMATRHVEGSRTSAPRDELPAPAAAHAAAPVPAPAPAPAPVAEPETEPEPVAVAVAEDVEPDTSSDEEE